MFQFCQSPGRRTADAEFLLNDQFQKSSICGSSTESLEISVIFEENVPILDKMFQFCQSPGRRTAAARFLLNDQFQKFSCSGSSTESLEISTIFEENVSILANPKFLTYFLK